MATPKPNPMERALVLVITGDEVTVTAEWNAVVDPERRKRLLDALFPLSVQPRATNGR
jgi:inosine-uridine nucleoside N-ribohydrolase